MKKKSLLLFTMLTAFVVTVVSLSTLVFANSQSNVAEGDQVFTIPMNAYCDTSHTANLSINITNLSGENANVTLKLFKKDGSQQTTAGSSYNGIESAITPGTSISIGSNTTENYRIAFGGGVNNCSDRVYYGSISSSTNSQLLAGGWVDSTIGNATLLINNGQPWDSVGSNESTPTPTPSPTSRPQMDACSLTTYSLIEPMTGDSDEYGTATSSSYDNTHNSRAFAAFDNGCGAFSTAAGNKTGWLQYEFNVEKRVNSYSILMKNNDPANAYAQSPNSWVFEAYDNQAQKWVALDTQSNVTLWTTDSPNTYSFSNTTAYNKYRLNFKGNNGGAVITVAEVGMMGY